MFDVDVDGVEYRESDDEEPGEEIVLSETDDGVELGLTICYDLRFPELYRILALRGARVLRGAGGVHDRHDARPLGDAAARAGDREPGVRRRRQPDRRVPPGGAPGGRSMIVDPWGVVLAQAPDQEGLICAELDLQRPRRSGRAAVARQPPPARLSLARGAGWGARRSRAPS